MVASPRQILRAQTARLAERGWIALAGTELEFIVYNDSYEQAADKGYAGPRRRQPVQRGLLDTRHVQDRPAAAQDHQRHGRGGLYVESAKGECNFGQHEIAFRYSDAVTTCDNHSIYKTGAKEIAAQEGMSLTFMAKPNQREGNSCHIHLSIRELDAAPGVGGNLALTAARSWPATARTGCPSSASTSWPGSSPRCAS